MTADDALPSALAAIDRERVAELCAGLVDIASPTGEEAAAAEWIAAELAASGVGVDVAVQRLDDRQANAVAHVGVPGDGPDLLLYAPIDTLTTGNADEDVPWLAERLPDHARPVAQRRGDRISGLGAHNPKGHAACVMAAIEAVASARVPLRGRLTAAFGAGGMPTNGRPAAGSRRNTGHGVGASFLLEQGGWADAAVIAKSGWAVAWEEVGLVWIDVTVGGTHTYVGARHRLPYRNAIADAGRVAAHLEQWFPTYERARHAHGLHEPQGVVAAVEAGWWRMAAVTPAVARLRVDLRLGPGQSPLDAWRELDAALDELRHGDDGEQGDPIDVRSELALSIPGTRTDPDHWIVTTSIAAWEAVAGRPHEPIVATSGATDANILRSRGIPTVRVGLPKVVDEHGELDFAAGMNTVDVGALELLTRHLVTTAVLAGTRSRAELTGGDDG